MTLCEAHIPVTCMLILLCNYVINKFPAISVLFLEVQNFNEYELKPQSHVVTVPFSCYIPEHTLGGSCVRPLSDTHWEGVVLDLLATNCPHVV